MKDKQAKKKKEIEPNNIAAYETFCEMKAAGLSLREISEKIGCAESTLGLWKKKEDFDEKVLKYRQKFKREDLLKADKCVRENLEASNLKAAEVVYKREGEFNEKVEISGEVGLTADAIQKIVEASQKNVKE